MFSTRSLVIPKVFLVLPCYPQTLILYNENFKAIWKDDHFLATITTVIKLFWGPTFARPSLLAAAPIALCRPSSFEDETGAGSVPRNNRGSFIAPEKSRGCLCTTPWDMKQRRSRRWCGASASSMIITTEPRRNPPPRIPAREHQITVIQCSNYQFTPFFSQ